MSQEWSRRWRLIGLLVVVPALLGLMATRPSYARGPKSKSGLPRCLQGMENTSGLARYVAYLDANPGVLGAFDPCQYPAEVLERFIGKLAAAESSGVPPEAALPQAYLTKRVGQSYVNLTQDEGYDVVAAKLAHILYVEAQRLVPWTLASYDDTSLASLFNVCKQMGCSFGNRKRATYFSFQNVADYSPRVTWTLLSRSLDLGSLRDATSGVNMVIEHARSFRHGSNDLDPDSGIVTVDEMAAERVARQGCWSMAPYVVALAAALNIPGDLTNGYFGGEHHQTALFPVVDGVLAHGDDVYNASLRRTPLNRLLDSYRRWESDVLKYKPLEGPTSPAGLNSKVHDLAMARMYPSSWTMSRYCGLVSGADSGREFLKSFFGNYATEAELDDLAARIVEATAGCSAIPPDM